MSGLRDLQKKYSCISEVRGLGLMIGCEFRTKDRAPDKALTKKILQACLECHMILLSCGPWDNTIRLIPPLVITAEEVDLALETFEKALEETTKN